MARSARYDREAANRRLRATPGTYLRLSMVPRSARSRFATMCRHVGELPPLRGYSRALTGAIVHHVPHTIEPLAGNHFSE